MNTASPEAPPISPVKAYESPLLSFFDWGLGIFLVLWGLVVYGAYDLSLLAIPMLLLGAAILPPVQRVVKLIRKRRLWARLGGVLMFAISIPFLQAKDTAKATQEARTSKNEVSVVSERANHRARETLGVSYEKVVDGLNGYFSCARGKDSDGKPNYICESKNTKQHALIQILGIKDDVSSVSLLFGMTGDKGSLIANVVAIQTLLKNALGKESGSKASDWVANEAMQNAVKLEKTQAMEFSEFTVEVAVLKALGMASITIKPN